jgi:mono/diheme cytochrome c family protein
MRDDGKPDPARLLSGGEGKLADGSVWRAPNITLDLRSGIGMWNDAQIVTAIRQGVRPDGVKLAPIMPYPFYHRMTDADARAVVAYLRSQKPIDRRIGKSDRLPMKPVDLAAPVNNVDDTSDPKAHGAYLASLMHCQACHGANGAGGEAFPLAGGKTVYAPNITSDLDTGIGEWKPDDIARLLRTMHRPDGSALVGPMAMYVDAWSRLTDEDAHAVAVFVKSLPPVRHEVEHQHPVTGMP